ncbi:hypothetical protein E2320_000805 [Naja naja]|nr:hypothetical protein E2320_000805 [Naja naja]
MHLLSIFALTFTLSAQQDNKNDADGESMENGNEMMNKVLDALSEKDTMEIIVSNSLTLFFPFVVKYLSCMQLRDPFGILPHQSLAGIYKEVNDSKVIYLRGELSCFMRKAMIPILNKYCILPPLPKFWEWLGVC